MEKPKELGLTLCKPEVLRNFVGSTNASGRFITIANSTVNS